MEYVRSWPSAARAAHYREQAKKYREMAKSEAVETLQSQLLALAAEYERLANSLAKSSP
jgi:molecular chaperone GrpE (heat shock protein)